MNRPRVAQRPDGYEQVPGTCSGRAGARAVHPRWRRKHDPHPPPIPRRPCHCRHNSSGFRALLARALRKYRQQGVASPLCCRQVAAGTSPVGDAPPKPKPTPPCAGKLSGSLGRRQPGSGAARPTEAGTFLLESWGEPSTAQQTRMRGKRGDGGESESERGPGCVHHRRHLLAASIDEARLECIDPDEVDRAQVLPIKIKPGCVAPKVQLLTGDRHLSRAVDHPSRLGVTCRFAPPGGIADCGTQKTSDDECGIADRDHTVVLVPPVPRSSPGRTLARADSKSTVATLKSRCRGDQRATGQAACQEIRDDIARVP